MKKLYTQPEWQVKEFSEEDIITASGVKEFTNDNFGLFDDNTKVDNWEW